jgi:hypothetical protein
LRSYGARDRRDLIQRCVLRPTILGKALVPEIAEHLTVALLHVCGGVSVDDGSTFTVSGGTIGGNEDTQPQSG